MLSKLRFAFDENLKNKNIKAAIALEGEIENASIEISKIPDKKDHIIVNPDQIWAKYEQIISVAATCGKPLTDFTQLDKDVFNMLVFRDLYQNKGSKEIMDPQNMMNQSAGMLENGEALIALIDRISALEKDVLHLNMQEERKSDREIFEKINHLYNYVHSEIDNLSSVFNRSL